MSYRTTRAFERTPATIPALNIITLTFGKEFKRMMDGRVVLGLVAVLKLLRL